MTFVPHDLLDRKLLQLDEIKPVRAYADPRLATHMDGSAIGCEIIPHKWQTPGLVVLVDDAGNIAIQRFHNPADVIRLGPFKHEGSP